MRRPGHGHRGPLLTGGVELMPLAPRQVEQRRTTRCSSTSAPTRLDLTRPIAVLCTSGRRAAVAAGLLRRHGAERVIHVIEGGVPKWGELGQPIER